MNTPSVVSISDMPAANSSGRAMTAPIGGLPWCDPPPVAAAVVRASRPTSDAVSKPRPKRTPTGYMCQESDSTLRHRPPRMRLMNPRCCISSSRCSGS